MAVTKDRHVRMQARRYQEVEDTLQTKGKEFGIPAPLMRLLEKMVAYEPTRRYQTPAELIEAIQTCRVEVPRAVPAAGNPRIPTGPKTLYAIETNEKLKQAFREKFKDRGYRVLLSADPSTAIKRYQEQPYHTLIADAGSVGREAVVAFNRVLKESDAAKLDLAAILLLGEKQKDWASDAISHPRGAVLFLPLNMKDLIRKIRELSLAGDEPE